MKQITFAIDRSLGVADPVWPDFVGKINLDHHVVDHTFSFAIFQMYTM